MGFFSYECKKCDHSILSSYSSDPEINGWMKDAVVLSPNGSRVIGEYGGYGDIGGMSAGEGHISGDAVWLHQACWEQAGKPEYDHFRRLGSNTRLSRRSDRKVFTVVTFSADAEQAVLVSKEDEQVTVNKVAEGLYTTEDREVFEVAAGSDSAGDQGYFFGKEHDVIDPRITDEAERARLLAEGIEKREARWYDGRARKVAEWLDPSECRWHAEDKKKEPWRHRFSYFETCVHDENDKIVEGDDGRGFKDGTNWYVTDEISTDEDDEGTFKGTEEELKADLVRRWGEFVESDEAKAYIARRKEITDAARAEMVAELREKGRFEVSYGPAKGDTVEKEGERDWTGSRSIHTVHDRLLYEEIVKFDGPDKALGVKTFQGKYPEDRIEEMRASGRESRRLAEDECQRLNDQWARDGYALPEGWDI